MSWSSSGFHASPSNFAAKAIGATAVKYPKPPGDYENDPPDENINSGVRVGIITRADEDEAWRIAHERFPEDRKGELAHHLAAAGLARPVLRGMVYSPFSDTWTLADDLDVNYLAAAAKP